jgi:hypothetical protein
MSYYVAILSKIETINEEILLERHITFLNELTSRGLICARGPFMDGSGGMIIYKAVDEETAYTMASSDPFVTGGGRSLVLKAWKGTFPG